MSRDFRLSMGLDFQDNASRDMARVLRDGVKQVTDATRAAERQGETQKKAATDATQAEKQHADTLRKDGRENISASRRQVEEYRRPRTRGTLHPFRAGYTARNRSHRCSLQQVKPQRHPDGTRAVAGVYGDEKPGRRAQWRDG